MPMPQGTVVRELIPEGLKDVYDECMDKKGQLKLYNPHVQKAILDVILDGLTANMKAAKEKK